MGASMNFAEYREMLHVVNPPCVPFLGNESFILPR